MGDEYNPKVNSCIKFCQSSYVWIYVKCWKYNPPPPPSSPTLFLPLTTSETLTYLRINARMCKDNKRVLVFFNTDKMDLTQASQ